MQRITLESFPGVGRRIDAQHTQYPHAGQGFIDRFEGKSGKLAELAYVLLNHILNGVRENRLSVTGVKLRDYQYQGCIGCERCRKDKICTGQKDGMTLLYPELIQSRGLVLVCPTHHYNVTAWMKAFIDRLYCFYDFDDGVPRGWSSRLAGQGRKAVLTAVCEQENKKRRALRWKPCDCPLKLWATKFLANCPCSGHLQGQP